MDVKLLINELIRRVEELKSRIRWSDDLDGAMNELKNILRLKW